MRSDIVIDENGTVGGYGISDGTILFALCSNTEHGRKQITPFFSCRDYINDSLYNYYNGKAVIYQPSGRRELLDTKKLRLLITGNHNGWGHEAIDTWRKNLYVAKHVINMYEKLAGFKTKSVLAEVTHSNKRIKRCWQLVGPKEWMRYSHLTSMVTLIIRSIVRSPTVLDTPDSLEKAEKMMATLRITCVPHSDYTTYLPACLPLFSKLMSNFDKVFFLSPEEVHKESNTSNAISWHSRGGIYSLCIQKTLVPKIDETIKNINRPNKK